MDAIDMKATAKTVAKHLKLNEHRTYNLLEALVSIGLLSKEGNMYLLAPITATHLVCDFVLFCFVLFRQVPTLFIIFFRLKASQITLEIFVIFSAIIIYGTLCENCQKLSALVRLAFYFSSLFLFTNLRIVNTFSIH